MRIKLKNRSKTSHLSLDELKELKSKYYSGENVNSLVKKYRINVHANSLCSSFPLILSSEKVCIHCDSNMYFVPPLKNTPNKKEYYCMTCRHVEGVFVCECTQCVKLKYEKKKKYEVERILEVKNKKDYVLSVREYPNSPSFDKLSIKEKVYLGALLRVGLDEKHLLISLDYGIPNDFAPMLAYRELIIAVLLDRKIITPYTFDNDRSNNRYRDFSITIHYDICISDVDKNKKELIISLMYPEKVPLHKWDETIDLLKEVQINEAIEYMMLTLQQFSLPIFEIEQKHEILFMKILEKYSQGQLFNFIYSMIKDLAAYSKSNYQKYIPISNYLHKKILDRFEYATMNKWNISNYRRAWQGKQTELSKLVSNRLLDIGESSFYQLVDSEIVILNLKI